MSINFKKLNSQIKPLKPEARHVGYIFIDTDKVWLTLLPSPVLNVP